MATAATTTQTTVGLRVGDEQLGEAHEVKFQDVPNVAEWKSDGALGVLLTKFHGVLNVAEPGGAVGDGITDDWPAFKAAVDAMGPANLARGLRMVLPRPVAPGAFYRLSKSWDITRECIIDGSGAAGDLAATIIKPDLGVKAIVIHGPATSPDGGRGGYSKIRDIRVESRSMSFWSGPRSYVAGDFVRPTVPNGFCYRTDAPGFNSGSQPNPWPTVEGQTVSDGGITWTCVREAGIVAYARVALEDVYVASMRGPGCFIYGNNADPLLPSNANLFRIIGGTFHSNDGHGLHVKGIDANAGVVVGLDCSFNRGWGIYDEAFLGNTFIQCHAADNGLGAYKVVSAVSTSDFVGCYSESGQPPSDNTGTRSKFWGGIHAAGHTETSLGLHGCKLQGDWWGGLNVRNNLLDLSFGRDNRDDLVMHIERLQGGPSLTMLRSTGVGSEYGAYSWLLNGVARLLGLPTSESYGGPRLIMQNGFQVGTHEGSQNSWSNLPTYMTDGEHRDRGDLWLDPDPAPGGHLGKVNVRRGWTGTTFVPGASYSLGQKVEPTTPDGLIRECVVPGVAGAEPAWAPVAGNLTTTGGATFVTGKAGVIRQDSTHYEVGTFMFKGAVPSQFVVYRCVVAGDSDSSPPALTDTIGQRAQDGSVTWRCEGVAAASARWLNAGPIANS